MSIWERTSAKSIAACLPTIVTLMRIQAPKNDIGLCVEFFSHFLRARQLSDDALDWETDFWSGHTTLMTWWVIDELAMHGDYRRSIQSANIRAAHQILKDIRKARKYAQRISCLPETDFLLELLKPYENSARNVLKNASN